MMAIGFAYGTLYMIAVGVWFAFHDFGWTAVYIAIPGWLGYAVPSFIKYARYRRAPMATALEPIEYGSGVTSSLIGWAAISSACWAVNVLFMGPVFLKSYGHGCDRWLFYWPLLEFFYVADSPAASDRARCLVSSFPLARSGWSRRPLSSTKRGLSTDARPAQRNNPDRFDHEIKITVGADEYA
jgi:hypothetical protein